MNKAILFIVNKLRGIRGGISTQLTILRLHSCGKCFGAARIAHISSVAKVDVGNHVSFNGMTISGYGSVKIGNYFHSGTNVKIMLGSHDYVNDEWLPYGKGYTQKKVVIDDFVWLASDVTISGNVHIGEGAIVAIGSVVVKDVPKCAIVGGNPAKIIKYRDIEKFDKLKGEGKY